jgi:hypothetical protein
MEKTMVHKYLKIKQFIGLQEVIKIRIDTLRTV